MLPGAQAGALVLLDSCQYLPHRTTDVQALGCDWLVASGHKMLGPTSSGFLWGRWAVALWASGTRLQAAQYDGPNPACGRSMIC